MRKRDEGKAQADLARRDRAFRIESLRLERILMSDGALDLSVRGSPKNGSDGGDAANKKPESSEADLCDVVS
jgi:hypothetical protein